MAEDTSGQGTQRVEGIDGRCPDGVPIGRRGALYFIQCDGSRGPVKIGHTQNVSARVSNIRMSNPYQIDLLVAVTVDRVVAVESQTHRRFARTRMTGEWFAWSPELAALVEAALAYEVKRAAGESGLALPLDLVVVGDVEPVESTAAPHAIRAAARSRRVRATARRESRRLHEESMGPPEPRPARADGAFVWRGKVRIA